jgi:putative transport protein
LRSLIRDNPVLLLFLVFGIGYVIGGIRFGSFRLGAVAGVLLAGLLLGHLGFESNPAIQSLGFVLFIFSVGYQAGPKFVQAIRKDGRRYLLIAVIVAATGFLLAYGASRASCGRSASSPRIGRVRQPVILNLGPPANGVSIR